MAESEILLTVAEIAVAFAGFASLVGILGQARSTDSPPINALRLQGMLESAMISLVFALVPFVPYLFGSSAATAWRIAAFCFAATTAHRLLVLVNRIPEARAGGVNMRWLVVIVAIQGTATLALLAVAVGTAGELAAGAYILALLLVLFSAGVFFMRLAVAMLASQEPAV